MENQHDTDRSELWTPGPCLFSPSPHSCHERNCQLQSTNKWCHGALHGRLRSRHRHYAFPNLFLRPRLPRRCQARQSHQCSPSPCQSQPHLRSPRHFPFQELPGGRRSDRGPARSPPSCTGHVRHELPVLAGCQARRDDYHRGVPSDG